MMPLLLAALFLPLFPFSIVLNWLLARLTSPAARFLLLLLWPQIGILVLSPALLSPASQTVAQGMVAWALLSSAFYALRLLTVRDLGRWAGFMASSALALTWGLAGHGSVPEMQVFAFGFGLPAALLALLTGPLTERFGAAFAGLYPGFAGTLPRLSGMLVFTVLAATATPPSPGFFAMLGLLDRLDWPMVPGVLAIWLFWGWAAMKLMQGFLSGEGCIEAAADIGKSAAALYTVLIGIFVVAGLFLTGGLS